MAMIIKRNIINLVLHYLTKHTKLRLEIYIFLIFTLAVSLLLLSKHKGVTVFAENGPVEYAQFGIIIAASFTFFVGAIHTEKFQKLSYALVILLGLASIRELDALMDKIIPVIGWKLPALCVGVYGLFFCWQNRCQLKSQIDAFLTSCSFLILCGASVVILPLSQLLGWKVCLKSLLGTDYSRSMKRLIEESIELLGYFILLLGSIEFILENQYQKLVAVAEDPELMKQEKTWSESADLLKMDNR